MSSWQSQSLTFIIFNYVSFFSVYHINVSVKDEIDCLWLILMCSLRPNWFKVISDNVLSNCYWQPL